MADAGARSGPEARPARRAGEPRRARAARLALSLPSRRADDDAWTARWAMSWTCPAPDIGRSTGAAFRSARRLPAARGDVDRDDGRHDAAERGADHPAFRGAGTETHGAGAICGRTRALRRRLFRRLVRILARRGGGADGAVARRPALAWRWRRPARCSAARLFILAGLYEFSPLKHRCLSHCRSPLEWIAHHHRPGAAGRAAHGRRARPLLRRLLLGADAAALRRRRDEPALDRGARRRSCSRRSCCRAGAISRASPARADRARGRPDGAAAFT